MVALVIEVQYLELDFHDFEIKKKEIYITCSTHNFYISRMPISYSRITKSNISISHFITIL